jgi:hypothetical protein
MKCPHKELLSVYFDGELPSPWKEKMDLHVAGCASCARALEAYQSLSLKPSDADIAETGAARERVWRRLETDAAPVAFKRRMPDYGAVWRRQLSVPLPAAAAVAVLFVALAVFSALRAPGAAKTPVMAIAAEADFESPGIIPAADMESVLQYLSSRDNGDMLILRLPESRNFVNYGEPEIIRAADYSRQTPDRQTGRRQKGERQRNRRSGGLYPAKGAGGKGNIPPGGGGKRGRGRHRFYPARRREKSGNAPKACNEAGYHQS